MCLFESLRLRLPDPEDLGGHVVGPRNAAKHRRHAVFAVFRDQFFDLRRRTGIDPVQDRLAQRSAVFVHGDAVTAHDADARAGHLRGNGSGFFQQFFCDPAELLPPDLRVHLVKARLRIFYFVRDCRLRHRAEAFIDQHSLCLVGPYVDPQKQTVHSSPLARRAAAIKAFTFSTSTRPSAPFKAVPTQAPSAT